MMLIIDLDDTLVNTTPLNNESYNYSLLTHGLNHITTGERITRKSIEKYYPNIDCKLFRSIVKIKQDYFINNLSKLVINFELLAEIIKQGKTNCLLWTSADLIRVKEILQHFNLTDLFIDIMISDKERIDLDLKYICNYFKKEEVELVFYENDLKIIKKLKKMNIKVIDVNL